MKKYLSICRRLAVMTVCVHVSHYIASLWHRLGWYALLMFNGMLIAMAIHIAVAALAVLTQEMENTIWLYRDLMALGRFPSDIYTQPMRGIITYVFPIAVMISFPAKAYLG